MPEEDLKKLVARNLALTEKIYQTLEKQRKLRMWTLIIGIVVVVLPLIAAMFAIPWMLNTMGSYYGEILDL